MAPLTKLVAGPLQSAPNTKCQLPGSPVSVSVPNLCCLQPCVAAAMQQPSSNAAHSSANLQDHAMTKIQLQLGANIAQHPHSSIHPGYPQSILVSNVSPEVDVLRSCLGGGGL